MTDKDPKAINPLGTLVGSKRRSPSPSSSPGNKQESKNARGMYQFFVRCIVVTVFVLRTCISCRLCIECLCQVFCRVLVLVDVFLAVFAGPGDSSDTSGNFDDADAMEAEVRANDNKPQLEDEFSTFRAIFELFWQCFVANVEHSTRARDWSALHLRATKHR